jgi:hypothetical protein
MLHFIMSFHPALKSVRQRAVNGAACQKLQFTDVGVLGCSFLGISSMLDAGLSDHELTLDERLRSGACLLAESIYFGSDVRNEWVLVTSWCLNHQIVTQISRHRPFHLHDQRSRNRTSKPEPLWREAQARTSSSKLSTPFLFHRVNLEETGFHESGCLANCQGLNADFQPSSPPRTSIPTFWNLEIRNCPSITYCMR